MAAPDPVACWGAVELMRQEFALPIAAITGPATDNEVGQVYITTGLGLPAHNARRDAAGLLAVVKRAMEEWTRKAQKTEKAQMTEKDEKAGSLRLGGVTLLSPLCVLCVLSVFSVLSI
jgi:hypothetical protein